MWNIKALALTVQKLLARSKFQRGGQNYRITEWQNYRITDRTKTICHPIFDLGDIKILLIFVSSIHVLCLGWKWVLVKWVVKPEPGREFRNSKPFCFFIKPLKSMYFRKYLLGWDWMKWVASPVLTFFCFKAVLQL